MRKNLRKCLLLFTMVLGIQTAYAQIPFDGYTWNKVADPNFKVQLEKEPGTYWNIYWENVESGKEYYENYCKYKYTGSKTNYSEGVHEFTQTSSTNAMRSEMKVEYSGYKADGIYQMEGYVQFTDGVLSGKEICQIWQNIDGAKILIYRTSADNNGTLYLPSAAGRNVILSKRMTNVYDYNNENGKWLKVNWVHFRAKKMVYVYLNDELYVQYSHVTPDGDYYFKFGNYGKITDSKEAKVTWKNMKFFVGSAGSCDVPAAPSILAGKAVSPTQIDLTWNDNSGNETGFELQRSYTSDFASITYTKPLGANVESVSNSNLTPGNTYFYRIKALNACGSSAYSNVVSVTTPEDVTVAPAAPSNFVATAVSPTQINLSWTDNATNESNFVLEQSADGTNYTILATPAANSTAYSVSGLSENSTYYFRLKAVNTAGSSNTVSANAKTPLSKPVAPSNLVATAISSSQIDVSWTDNSFNEDSFVIERDYSADFPSSPYNRTFLENVTGYSNINLTANRTYFYRVRAFNAAGASAYSNVASATTFPLVDNIAFEAESAVITSPMKIVSDATASGGKYIVTTGYNSTSSAPSSGTAVLTFTAQGGTYKVWGRTLFAGGGDNSFWVKVDNGAWVAWNDDAAVSPSWKWNLINASLTLTAGTHTISFAYREDNSKLDRIAISNDPAYDPAVILKADEVSIVDAKFGLQVITGNSQAKVSYSLSETALTSVVIYNMQGKALQTLVNETQAAGEYSRTINTGGLPTGIYIVKMVSGSNVTSQKFMIK